MRGLIAGLALLAAACAPRPPEPGDRPPPGPALLVAGEEKGYLEPCGCTRPQLGGLARKGSALGGAPLLENGDFVPAGGRLNEIKLETFLLAFTDLGVRAANVGEKDLELGIDFLRSAGDLAGFPLLSANLLGAEGRPVFAPFADFEAGGRRWRVVGVLDPALAPGHRVSDPAAAVGEALRDLPAGTAAVVLYHGAEAGAKRILDAHPAVETVVFAHTDGEPVVRSPRLAAPGDRSRFLLRLGARPAVIELGEEWPDDPRMVRAMATYVRRIGEEDLLHRMNPGAPPREGGYAGDAACASCHADEARIHGGSRHARALGSLKRTSRHLDPDCVECHVIGYGEKTGFLSEEETPALAHVGCESCHGPGRRHLESGSRLPDDARAACARCHNADTDPGFRFEQKWPAVRHGGKVGNR